MEGVVRCGGFGRGGAATYVLGGLPTLQYGSGKRRVQQQRVQTRIPNHANPYLRSLHTPIQLI